MCNCTTDPHNSMATGSPDPYNSRSIYTADPHNSKAQILRTLIILILIVGLPIMQTLITVRHGFSGPL